MRHSYLIFRLLLRHVYLYICLYIFKFNTLPNWINKYSFEMATGIWDIYRNHSLSMMLFMSDPDDMFDWCRY